MAVVLYLLGWLAVLGGGGWAALSLSTSVAEALRRGGAEPLPSLLALAIATPGLGMMLGGLLLLAAGGVLTRLDRIVRNTGETLELLEAQTAQPVGTTNTPAADNGQKGDVGPVEPRF